jgi:hypothetical protein
VIEDPDTEIGLGWVGFHHRKGTEVSCVFWLAADVRGRGLMTFLARRGGADRPVPQRPPRPTAG